MTTTSVSSEPLSSNYLSSFSSSSSFHNFTRRHSIYGTEDRVVLDIGSLYIKVGFSGESAPRHIVPTWSYLRQYRGVDGEVIRANDELGELYSLNIMAKGNLDEIEERLKKLLHEIYFRLLLTDPKSRKVIICESPLTPVVLKQIIARLLFEHFQVHSISFVPIHLMALLTTGLTTGLIIDVGHLETTILPIYASRPLIPFISTTPLAGKSITVRLKQLLLDYGRFIPPSNLHLSLAPHQSIPENILTPELLEDIKTRVIFCSPLMIVKQAQSDGDLASKIESYKNFSSATDLYYPIILKEGTKATLSIPGWIRERAVEVLFEGDDDEPSITQCIMEALLKLQPDLRKPLISSMLLIGGISLLPGFQSRLKQELLRIMRDPLDYEKRRYESLLRLHKSIKFIDNSEEKGSGRVFMNNVRGWVGGSLVGSLKLSGEEILRDKFTGTVTDWSIGNWSHSSDNK
ncbi:actin family [Cokeromyces recurvatus]|uniref:actin family n=1 Tax=Cokeromyces recurvatus TaxID=90255 RepID=UPI0022206407|nr:actin family [Cokeromyces recurvatus]KAI7904381.1 actin family [Cokeromyces recurvatus]